LIKQTEITRNGLLADVDKLDDKLFDVQPTGFNNTIHWHIGHILTVTEQFVFGFPKQSQHIPKHYYDLFTNGTKPSDWSGDVHSFSRIAHFILGFSQQLHLIAEQYHDVVKVGTKPRAWSVDVPSVATLSEQLRDQLDRIKHVAAEHGVEPLVNTLSGQVSFG